MTDDSSVKRQYTYGSGEKISDATVEVYAMKRLVASDAVAKAKEMFADEHGVDYGEVRGRKLRRVTVRRPTVTFVAVAHDPIYSGDYA